MHRFPIIFAFLFVDVGATSAEPMSESVGMLPLESFVQMVGGERVETRFMVQPSQTPATCEPTPKQIAALAADLYVRVGVPFEDDWMKRIRSANRDMSVLDLHDGLRLRPMEARNHEDGSGHGAADAAGRHRGPMGELPGRQDDRCDTARRWAQRRRVLEIDCRAERPMGAYEMLDLIRDDAPAAPPTVYRALDSLLEQGLVHKLETLHAYVGCTHPDHPHSSQFLICADFGDVTELDDESIAGSRRKMAAETGFKPQRPIGKVIGTCAVCALKPRSEAAR
ncbi:MAG: zinc ABC transporter substrate-binding protein [Thiohalocapsa sp.]